MLSINTYRLHMILTIDIGNSNKKYSVFSEDALVEHGTYRDQQELSHMTKVILSSVKKENSFISPLERRVSHFIKNNSLIDMPIHYSKEVGEDRLASAYYVFKNWSGKNLCIDTGTFTTVDTVSSNGFEGGVILPGLKNIEEIYNKGDLLRPYKIVKDSSYFETHSPKNTQSAIKEGIKLSYLAPLLMIIKQQNPNYIIITGGNGELLHSFLTDILLKEGFAVERVQYNKQLIHQGLHLMAKESNL